MGSCLCAPYMWAKTILSYTSSQSPQPREASMQRHAIAMRLVDMAGESPLTPAAGARSGYASSARKRVRAREGLRKRSQQRKHSPARGELSPANFRGNGRNGDHSLRIVRFTKSSYSRPRTTALLIAGARRRIQEAAWRGTPPWRSQACLRSGSRRRAGRRGRRRGRSSAAGPRGSGPTAPGRTAPT